MTKGYEYLRIHVHTYIIVNNNDDDTGGYISISTWNRGTDGWARTVIFHSSRMRAIPSVEQPHAWLGTPRVRLKRNNRCVGRERLKSRVEWATAGAQINRVGFFAQLDNWMWSSVDLTMTRAPYFFYFVLLTSRVDCFHYIIIVSVHLRTITIQICVKLLKYKHYSRKLS